MENQFTPEVTSDDKLWAALAYALAPIVSIILLLMEDKKSRPFLKFHAVQSLIAGLAMGILATVLAPFTLGCSGLLWFVMFYWAYQAYQGKQFTIPVITDLIHNQGWA